MKASSTPPRAEGRDTTAGDEGAAIRDREAIAAELSIARAAVRRLNAIRYRAAKAGDMDTWHRIHAELRTGPWSTMRALEAELRRACRWERASRDAVIADEGSDATAPRESGVAVLDADEGDGAAFTASVPPARARAW